MEFYTVWAKDRLATENDNRKGPFTSLTDASAHLLQRADCDSAIISFFGCEWYRIEREPEANGAWLCKPLGDMGAYWEILDYKEE